MKDICKVLLRFKAMLSGHIIFYITFLVFISESCNGSYINNSNMHEDTKGSLNKILESEYQNADEIKNALNNLKLNEKDPDYDKLIKHLGAAEKESSVEEIKSNVYAHIRICERKSELEIKESFVFELTNRKFEVQPKVVKEYPFLLNLISNPLEGFAIFLNECFYSITKMEDDVAVVLPNVCPCIAIILYDSKLGKKMVVHFNPHNSVESLSKIIESEFNGISPHETFMGFIYTFDLNARSQQEQGPWVNFKQLDCIKQLRSTILKSIGLEDTLLNRNLVYTPIPIKPTENEMEHISAMRQSIVIEKGKFFPKNCLPVLPMYRELKWPNNKRIFPCGVDIADKGKLILKNYNMKNKDDKEGFPLVLMDKSYWL